MTEAHQAQIDKLRQLIRDTDRRIATLQAQRAKDRDELNALLASLRLPRES